VLQRVTLSPLTAIPSLQDNSGESEDRRVQPKPIDNSEAVTLFREMTKPSCDCRTNLDADRRE